MARVFVYSFESTNVTFEHPAIGSKTLYGEGLGDITISRINDVTTHEAALDGSVLVSKTTRKNANVTLNILQSSEANSFLNKWAKFIEGSDASQFALAQITIDSKSTGENWVCTGVSHQKIPDSSYQATGQYKTWNLMSAQAELT